MQRTGNILGEKVIRYFEDRLRARVRWLCSCSRALFTAVLCIWVQDTLIEKLRLKNSSLRVKKSKLQVQLKQVCNYCQCVD